MAATDLSNFQADSDTPEEDIARYAQWVIQHPRYRKRLAGLLPIQHRLYRGGTQPADHSSRQMVRLVSQEEKALSGRLGLCLSALCKRDHQGRGRGAGCRNRG